MTPVVVLVGPPGAGKSTVGRLVATALAVPLRDTDADVERVAGKSIGDIFIDEGESHFRELERAAVMEVLATHTGVVALGGGAVLNDRTRGELAAHRVVFLDVSVAQAAARVGFNRDRPLLLGDVRGRLRRLMEERHPLYEQVATATIPTDDRAPAEVAEEVLALVRPGVR
jgi:shikimate kinase